MFMLIFHFFIFSIGFFPDNQVLENKLNQIKQKAEYIMRCLHLLESLRVLNLFLLVLINKFFMREIEIEIPDFIFNKTMRGRCERPDEI